MFQGDSNWKNYEYSLFVTLEKGSCMQFPFRVTDDRKGFYFVEFDYAWQSINVTLREPDRHGVTKLSVVNYPLEKGREYHLNISARHRSLTTYIDGKLVNQVNRCQVRRGRHRHRNVVGHASEVPRSKDSPLQVALALDPGKRSAKSGRPEAVKTAISSQPSA